MLTTPEIIALIRSKIKEAQADKNECVDLKNYEQGKHFINKILILEQILNEIQ
jgi:hypothetical protein